MKCMNCGKNNNKGSNYCKYCGQKMDTDTTAPKSANMFFVTLLCISFVVVAMVVFILINVIREKNSDINRAENGEKVTELTETSSHENEAEYEAEAETETQDSTEESTNENIEIDASIDWKNLYWTYIQDNKLIKLCKTDEREDKWGFWQSPESIFVKDCDLNGIPEIYIGIYVGEHGTDDIGGYWLMLDIIDENVVSSKVFECNGAFDSIDSLGALSDEVMKIEGVSWYAIEELSDDNLEKDPDNIDSIKNYIWKDDFLKAETSRRDIMNISGTYKCTGYSYGLGNMKIGLIDNVCFFSFDGGPVSFDILNDSLSGEFTETFYSEYLEALRGNYEIRDKEIKLTNINHVDYSGTPYDKWDSITYEKIEENSVESVETTVADLLYDEQPENASYIIAEDIEEGWKKTYKEFLDKEKFYDVNQSEDGENLPSSYFIYDVDKDGIPELFIRYGDCEAAFHYTLFRYSNGQLEEVATNGCSNTSFYSCSGNGFFSYYAHMNFYTILKMQLNGNVLSYEEIANDHTETEYPDISSFEKDAHNINEYSLKTILPIMSYGVDLKTKSSLENDEAKEIITDVIDKDGKVYVVYCDYSGRESIRGDTKLSHMTYQGSINKYSDVELFDEVWGDLNMDGQDECLLLYKEKGVGTDFSTSDGVVLSYQNDAVYAYVIPHLEKNVNISDGKIISGGDYSITKKELYFYKNDIYINNEYIFTD